MTRSSSLFSWPSALHCEFLPKYPRILELLAMLTEDDRRRLLETSHDLDATHNPDLLTGHAEMQAAICASRTDLLLARDLFKATWESISALATHRHGKDASMALLRDARAALDRAALSHTLLIESVLTREAREAELGLFVLAKNLSYAARRLARLPLSDEPGIDRIDKELWNHNLQTTACVYAGDAE